MPINVRERIYNRAFSERGLAQVVMWEVMAIANQEIITIIFESKNSTWRQGVWLMTDKGLLLNQQLYPSVVLWAETAPLEVSCECYTESGLLHVYNVWDSGRGLKMESQNWSSGMLVENLANGRRYRCNDIGFETQFDKLVFRIEKG